MEFFAALESNREIFCRFRITIMTLFAALDQIMNEFWTPKTS